jgi:tetratricopeptide (TPR) repeat protein
MTPPDLQPRTLLSSAPPAPVASEPWTRMPYRDIPRFEPEDLAAHWPRLHAGQGHRPPAMGPLAEGWACYHNGDFEHAAQIGLRHGHDGLALANQATAIYANYLEPRESVRLALFRLVADRAATQVAAEPDNCQALYWQAYSLGRYSQGISVARALAQGLGSKVMSALERAIELQPQHADAHAALAAFHAEVIDKVGALVGRMTYGVRADTAIALFERSLQLNPHSASVMMEYARGLLMLQGDARMAEATRLYEKAAAVEPVDARERLDVELARSGLND